MKHVKRNHYVFYSLASTTPSVYIAAYDGSNVWKVVREELASWLEVRESLIRHHDITIPDLGDFEVVTVGWQIYGALGRPITRDELGPIQAALAKH
jgi:hypothetical protein